MLAGEADDLGECRPLIVEGAQVRVDEETAPSRPRPLLKRKCHERAESAVRQCVLVRNQAIVAGEREQAPLARCAFEQTEGESSGVDGCHWRIEEEPGVRPVPGARDLEQYGHVGVGARPGERLSVIAPSPTVEIGHEKTAATGAVERVQTDHFLAEEMAFDDAVRQGKVAASLPIDETAHRGALGFRVPRCRPCGRVAGRAL